MKNKIIGFFKRAAGIIGIEKNNKYVKDYLDATNMRSGIYMSAVIIILEIWLIIRQTNKYIIPQYQEGTNPLFKVIFLNTSTFWLLMSLGTAMLFYCFFYTSKKKGKGLFLASIISAAISMVFVGFLPLEFEWSLKFTPLSKGIYAYLKIAFYAVILLFDISVIVASIFLYKGKKNRALDSMLVISLFALACLAFGTMVSFGDFSSTAKFDDGQFQHKQIICFLMMSIYIGCLLIWKPYISVAILGAIFLGFYLLIDGLAIWVEGARQVPEGDQVNYITFLISITMITISIYDQRVKEAKKDEELIILATVDSLTGLNSFENFLNLVNEKIVDENLQLGEWTYLFIDVTSFKVFNDQRGFVAGNEFLYNVGQLLIKDFPEAIITRQSDDHYALFAGNYDLENRLNLLNDEIGELDLDIRPGIKVGCYVLRDLKEDSHQGIEKARYACAELKNHPGRSILYYDTKMHDKYRLTQYITGHVDDAIENGHIKAFYQPVTWSKSGELCGFEALARWIDPKYGFLSPGDFVPALEHAQIIYKLDFAVLEIVCRDMREHFDNNQPAVPVSINFSRLDFTIMDVPAEIEKIVEKYNIPREYIHVEITESALLEEGSLLKDAMKDLKKKRFSLWLDDFGSGYSSFNALKDFDFDVLKLDMQFLSGFKTNEKAKVVIKSIILMAEQIGMKTLCEGVETVEESNFLEEVGCGRQQGYLHGKPMPKEEVMEKINNKEYRLSKEFE